MLIMVDRSKLSFEKTVRIKDLLDEYESLKRKMISCIEKDTPFLVECWIPRVREVLDELESLGVGMSHTNNVCFWMGSRYDTN